MMISPETYYETKLKGRSCEEIMTQIRSLKREIGRLKRSIEEDTCEEHTVVCPDPLTRIGFCREYLAKAVEAYEAAGGAPGPQ